MGCIVALDPRHVHTTCRDTTTNAKNGVAKLLGTDLQIDLVFAGVEFLLNAILAAIEKAGGFVPGDQSHLDAGRHVLDFKHAILFGDREVRVVKSPDPAIHPLMIVATDVDG